jgi:hypothetical protein
VACFESGVHLARSFDWPDAFAGKPRSYKGNTKPVGARLAREGVSPNNTSITDSQEKKTPIKP